MPYGRLPELVALRSSQQGLRIPPGVTVPMTGRVRRLLDTATMRRLARVRQLGLVALVYPGAVHTSNTHSESSDWRSSFSPAWPTTSNFR
jgi:hypothetical protein